MLYASTYYGISGLGDDTLAHHGIKGQKWGVRRYQNADGSYTQAGKNRYFTDDGSLSKKGERAYRKDLKKLNKLKARADISQQKKNIEKYEKRADTAKKVGVAIASTGLAAGAGATYVYSKIQANAARKRISDIGHEKAVADVNRQIEHMKQTYGSVKLSELDKKKR